MTTSALTSSLTSAPTLASYLPHCLLERLARRPAMAGPELTRGPAVVMLSDIQGFTSLVEGYSRAGRDGLEALTGVLNQYFIELCDEVLAHGGDVLCIAGDAFLCTWPVDTAAAPADADAAPDAADDAPEAATAAAAALDATLLRAVHAAQCVQTRLHDRDAGRGYRFRTRIGIAAGTLDVALVGGVGGRWEVIASGPAMDAAAAAECICPPGGVTAAAESWARLKGRCSGDALADGMVALHALPRSLQGAPQRRTVAGLADMEAAELAPLLRPHVPPAVLARETGSEAWLAEFRPLTVLLADLPALVGGDAQALAQLHDSVVQFQQVIARFEGTLRVDVDDKGVMLLAVFGLPPRAHSDDARRAVRAAHALAQALAARGLARGIGIASGRAFCGAFGSDRRREYLVRGAVINLAARLMHATGSQVVCDHSTAQALRGAFELQALPALTVKGFAEPVRAWCPGAARDTAAAALRTPVGREEERRRLFELAQDLKARRQGGLVVVIGEAGLGKSILLAELRERARGLGLRVLQGAGGAIESRTGYFAWRPVFRALLRLDAAGGAAGGVAGGVAGVGAGVGADGFAGGGAAPTSAELAARVASRVAALMHHLPQWERLAPLLGDLLGLPLADSRLTAELSGAARAENTRQLAVAVLQMAAAQAPLLLLVEDAHWLDSGSWGVLNDLSAGVPGLALVVATRPPGSAEAAQALARLSAAPRAQTCNLDLLPPRAIAQLIAERLGVDAVPDSVLQLVQGRAEGHPFFCEELVQNLLESGALRVADDRCQLMNAATDALPSSVEGVILSRIDRLSPAQYLCLKVAAVVGLSFSLGAVAATLPPELNPAELPTHLLALSAANLTVSEEGGGFRFRHAITREVAYGLMPDAQRQPVHRAVAQWLEASGDGAANSTTDSALLAHHWSHAKVPDKTVHYLNLAGQQALRQGAFADALRIFTQARELHFTGAVRVDARRQAMWERGLGTAHYFLGDLPRSRQCIEAAVAMLDRHVPQTAPGRLAGLLAEAAQQAAHRRWPQRLLGRDAARREALDEVAEDYRTLGQIYYLDGEAASALVYVTLRGVNAGERAGPSPALARNLANMGTLCGFMGRPKWARWYGERAIEMAEQEGQVTAAAYVWNLFALMQAQAGRWAQAVQATTEAMQRVQRVGDYNLETEVWVVRSTALMMSGDFLRAQDAWEHQLALAQRKGNRQLTCWGLLDQAETLLARENTEAAAEVLTRALAIATAPSDGSSSMDKLHATALVRARQGRADEAAAAAREVLDTIARQSPTGYFWVHYAADATEVLIDLAHSQPSHPARADWLAQARRGHKSLVRLARVFGCVRPRVALLQASLHHIGGAADDARVQAQRALTMAEAMDMDFEAARARLLLGTWRQVSDPGAALQAAATTFDTLGAQWLATQARQALQGLDSAPGLPAAAASAASTVGAAGGRAG